MKQNKVANFNDKIDANDESGADLGKHNIFNILVIGI